MNRISTALAVTGLGLAVTPALAQDAQLVAAGGISRAQAQDLTLSEIAVYVFNRGSDSDDDQVLVARSGPIMVDPVRHAQLIAAAGLTSAKARGMTLNELAVARHNAATGGDERQWPVKAGASASAGAQLIAAAGLSPEEAQGMSLTEVAAAKFNRDSRNDDRQVVER